MARPTVRRAATHGVARAVCLATLLAATLGAADAAERAALDDIVATIDAGRYAEAERRIAAALHAPSTDAATREALRLERERMRRIRLDFSEDRAAVFARVRRDIPDLTDAQFDAWDRDGLFERMTIDGETRYFARAGSNLFRLSPAARARRSPTAAPLVDSPLEQPHPHHDAVRRRALETGRGSVLPQRVRFTQTLTVEADAVPDGESVRAWLPYPRALPGQQEDLVFRSSKPALHRIAPESAPQRTVFLEATAHAGQPVRFSISYDVTIYARYVAIDPARVRPTPDDAALAPFLAPRAPHGVFTDALRRYSRDVVGDEKNPYRIARKLYAAVDRIPWAGAREYSTIRNISDHTLHAGHGDCGQQTLLLITLLRLNGIPARWQSGWIFSDGTYDNLHDWGQLYLAPYGWVPVDVTFGRLAGERDDGPWFYLGGLDGYRVAMNDDYARPFVPPKTYERSDDVDSQRGEVEWRGGNLYFDRWDYHLDWQILPAAADRDTRR